MLEATSSTPAERRRGRQEQFARELRCLRAAAGNPSFRTMATRSGTVSHTTLHEAAKGTRFPSWMTTRAFVEACGGDVAEWRARWYAAFGVEETERATEQAKPEPEQAEPAAEEAETGVAGGPEAGDGGEVAVEGPGDTGARVRRPLRRYIVVSAVCGGLLVAGATAMYLRHAHHAPSRSSAIETRETPPPVPLVRGDRSIFVADVTIPDGTAVKVGERFVKTWEIANVGSVAWHGRFLQRAALPADNGTCSTPGKVRIPDTEPGRHVRVSVPVMAPRQPGSCWVGWKMVDGRGQQFLPGSRPVYFVVNVVE